VGFLKVCSEFINTVLLSVRLCTHHALKHVFFLICKRVLHYTAGSRVLYIVSGSVIHWPPGSGSVIWSYGSGSEKNIYLRIHNGECESVFNWAARLCLCTNDTPL
jgi:hypothetical protein